MSLCRLARWPPEPLPRFRRRDLLVERSHLLAASRSNVLPGRPFDLVSRAPEEGRGFGFSVTIVVPPRPSASLRASSSVRGIGGSAVATMTITGRCRTVSSGAASESEDAVGISVGQAAVGVFGGELYRSAAPVALSRCPHRGVDHRARLILHGQSSEVAVDLFQCRAGWNRPAGGCRGSGRTSTERTWSPLGSR